MKYLIFVTLFLVSTLTVQAKIELDLETFKDKFYKDLVDKLLSHNSDKTETLKVETVMPKVETPKPTVKVKTVVKPKPKSVVKKEEKIVNTFDAKILLAGKTIYLCYENKMNLMQRRLTEMHFGKDTVSYKTLLHENNAIEVPYTFDKGSVILNMSGLKFVHNIFAVYPTFIRIRSFKAGKASETTIRYYFNKNAALAFVQK